MKIFKILLMIAVTIAIGGMSAQAKAGCMIVSDPYGGSYEICTGTGTGGPRPPDPPPPPPPDIE